MSIYFCYFSLLMLIFILIYYGIKYTFNFAPIKIKLFGTITFSVLSFRYLALMIFLASNNIKYIYLLKPLVFLNLLYIPILAYLSLYILARNDKIRFNYSFALLGISSLPYVCSVAFLAAKIDTLGVLGYYMTTVNKNYTYGIYLIILTVFLLYCITMLGHKNSNKLGIIFILVSSIVTILELIVRYAGVDLFPADIVGDLFWIATTNYALHRFKK